MDVLDSSRREADRSTHADDLLALESVAALHPDVVTFRDVAPAAACSSGHKLTGRPCTSRRSTRSRAGSGATSSSTALLGGFSTV